MMMLSIRPSYTKRAAVAFVLMLTVACSGDPNTRKRKLVASGDAYAAKKNYAEAIIQYRNAVAIDGSFGEARAKLAAAYEAALDRQNALREYVRAADLMPDDVDVQLHAGKLLLAAGSFAEARARAMAALSKDPTNVNGLIVMGNALAGLKDVDGAISQLEQAIDVNPQLTFTYTNLGLLQLNRGNAPAAQATFERATRIQPKSVTAHLNLANFHWSSGHLADAERELKVAVALDSESEAANELLGVFYLRGNRASEAEPYLQKYAQLTKKVSGKLAVADFYLQSDRIDDARQILEPLSKDPKQRDAFVGSKFRLALIDYKADQKARAYATLEEILKRYAEDQQTLAVKARLLFAEHQYDAVVQIADSMIKADPKSARAHFIRGVALDAKGAITDAIGALKKVIEIDPSAVPAQREIARLYLAQGNSRSAMEFLNPLIKASPRSADLHFMMGQAQFYSGNLTAAEAEFVPLAAAVPKSVEFQIWLGRLYGTKGDSTRARKAFTRALELNPNSLTAINGLVSLALVEKRADAVRSLLEPLLAKSPESEPLLFLAGNSFLTIGDEERGESLLRKVLELNPSNISASGRLGALYFSQKRLEQAQAEFEELARKQKRPVAAKTLIGVLLDMQSRPEDAKKAYEDALALNPRAAVAANNLAMYHLRAGNLEAALQLAQTAKAAAPSDWHCSDTLGRVYYEKGLVPLAITALQESVQQNPQSAESHYYLGLAYLKDGNQDQAKKALEHALKLQPKFADAEDAKRVLATIKG